MKTVVEATEKQKERKFENEVLSEVIKEAKDRGYKVYTFESAGSIKQIFIEDIVNQRIGSASAYYGVIQFSTIHESKRGSGNGTGFGELIDGEDFNSPQDLDICFTTYPTWYKGHGEVAKYKSFAEFLEKGCGILSYFIDIKPTI